MRGRVAHHQTPDVQDGAYDTGEVMTDVRPVRAAIGRDSRRFAAGAIEALSFAAAPTFAVMALLTAAFGGGASDVLCSTQGGFPLTGMVPMYVLMSGVHLGPWLKLMLR